VRIEVGQLPCHSRQTMTADDWDWSLRIFDHVDLHAGDYAASVRFYDAVLAPLVRKLFADEQSACFANFNVVRGRGATQNLHLCFHARAKGQVDAFHRAGVEAGFRSNGAPGYRDYAPGYYDAYLLDPDGNNVEALYRDVGNVGHGFAATLR
jgi:catechol 2,3-dioxygenase-like lactoylglutathione lyase family enzyme